MSYQLSEINFKTVSDPAGFMAECDERYNALVREAADRILANKLNDPDCVVVIVCGDARGADALGERYAWRHHLKVVHFPADWDRYGNAAGPIRNEEMAKFADALIAFPLYGVANRGTLDMIRRARQHHLQVRVIT